MELPKDLKDKVWNYCRLNDITDVNGFIIKTIKKGLDVEVYGLLGKTLNENEKDLKTDNEGEKDLKTGIVGEKQVEIEVIREIRVEVPVEVIKEVEKVVTKIEYISDKNLENELLLKIQQLENRPPEIVEVVKEVPVDRVVEKIIYTTDDIQINELGGKIAKLEQEISTKTTKIGTIREEFSTKTTEMENIFQNEMSKKDLELDELRSDLDINLDDNKVKMLQQTVQNLTGEVRDLKKKNEELNKQMLDTPKQLGNISAKFHGSSNLNNDLYK